MGTDECRATVPGRVATRTRFGRQGTWKGPGLTASRGVFTARPRVGHAAGSLTVRYTSFEKERRLELSRSSFAVPVAFTDDGALVRPAEARVGEEHRCPGCGARVILRRGQTRRPHFAHLTGDGCSSESTLHRAAKHQVRQVIEEWKEGRGPRPCVSRPCPNYVCDGGVVQDIPDDVTHAEVEVRLDEGVVADVVLFRGDRPAAAIEIRVTHGVSADKATRLSVPWMELGAEQVLERPYWWVAQQDGLQPFVCPACACRNRGAALRLQAIRDRAVDIARRIQLTLPPNPPYEWVPHRCWRCESDTVVFLWPGGGDHSTAAPPDPIPRTLQHRVTEGGGDYWANSCPSCSTVQGDYYLTRDNDDYSFVRELVEDPYDALADNPRDEDGVGS
jgi:predicted RNA-binding Zn-ribbon protein involved in translation (DUF1610 family)